LHDKEIRPLLPDQTGDITDARSHKPKQIPTYDPKPGSGQIMGHFGVEEAIPCRSALVRHYANFDFWL
jgi:hypothetical protein